MFGAQVTLVGPEALLPVSTEGWQVNAVTDDLDAVLAETDICYVLRIQAERMCEAEMTDVAGYRERYGLTMERARQLPKGSFIMHPGPMIRGVELDADVTVLPGALMRSQVRNGVPVRMAVFFRLLAGESGEGLDEWR